MRRALLAVAFVASALAVAEGKRVVEPDLSGLCPGGKTWNAVAQCLGRHGKVRVAKTLGPTKLVKLVRTTDSGWRMPGFYLYTQSKGAWRMTGMLRGETWELVSLQQVKHAQFTGYRFDVKRAERDDITVLRQTMAVFCSDSAFCATAITACDYYISGKAQWTFRGTLEVGKDVVHVRGDRSKSGGECQQEEDVFLPEPPEPSIH